MGRRCRGRGYQAVTRLLRIPLTSVLVVVLVYLLETAYFGHLPEDANGTLALSLWGLGIGVGVYAVTER